MKPGVGGWPFTVRMRAVEEGLNKMSEAVPGGPAGGVVCFSGIGKRWVSGVRPVLWSVVKQATPATAPPFRTQAGLG